MKNRIAKTLSLIALALMVFSPLCRAQAQIAGDWQGTLSAGGAQLRLVLHVVAAKDGGLTATIDSVDQGANGIPVTVISLKDSKLSLTIDAVHGTYEGTINKDATAIDGTWSQGQPLELNFKRVKDQAGLQTRRPQTPVKPYPYREEEVTYANKAAGNALAATLTIPPGKGPFPAVLLISGSGPHDRDENLFGHKLFLVLSDFLTRRGIAVLRADKRGIGKSTGDYANATTADFVTDAEAGVAYLKTRAEVDPHKIGLIGHSEGGVVAPMVAARNSDVAFVVMMAGDGVPGDQITVEQVRLLDEAAGVGKEMAAQNAGEERELLALVETEKDRAALDKQLREKLAAMGVPEAQIGASIQALLSPWYRFFLVYDPAKALRKVACPVLVLNGEKDLQVPPAQNLPAIRKALEEGGNKHFEIDELPGLNHLFQMARSGSPAEYAEIEETLSPVALDKIAGWILKQ